jgi:hypothetical protein
MSISRAADLFYTYKFLRTLTKDWKEMEAYDLGIIDENGVVLKKASTLTTQEEKNAYTTFHRLVFNLKRILQKLPFGRTKLASYAAALFLLKENKGSESGAILREAFVNHLTENGFDEETLTEGVEEDLAPGVYKLKYNHCHTETLEEVFLKGSKVVIPVDSSPVDTILGVKIYEATHQNTRLNLYVTNESLEK